MSGSADQRADPNQLISVTDALSAISSAGERFSAIDSGPSDQVLRGISLTSGTTS